MSNREAEYHGWLLREVLFDNGEPIAHREPAAPTVVEPLFLLHTGQIDSSGEQDDWDCEADSGQRVENFCRQHPGMTIKLFATPPRAALTDAEIDAACGPCHDSDLARGFRAEFIKRFRAVYERLHILAASGGPRNE